MMKLPWKRTNNVGYEFITITDEPNMVVCLINIDTRKLMVTMNCEQRDAIMHENAKHTNRELTYAECRTYLQNLGMDY